jgi:hypothetical protein
VFAELFKATGMALGEVRGFVTAERKGEAGRAESSVCPPA